MEIKHSHIKDALTNWSVADSQRNVAMKITREYFALGMTVPALQRIELEDQTVDYAALHNNQQSILQRWLHGDTPAARKKIRQLLPAILAAMAPELRASLIAGNSVEYLATQAMKAHSKMISSILLRAPLADFETDCEVWERAFVSLRHGAEALLH